MPIQPPTRPHSANPQQKSIQAPSFPREPSPSSSSSRQKPTSSHSRTTSGLSHRRRESDWENAWDSSSDREDEEHGIIAPTPRNANGSKSIHIKTVPSIMEREGSNGSARAVTGEARGANGGESKDVKTGTGESWGSSFHQISPTDESELSALSQDDQTDKFSRRVTEVNDSATVSKLPPGGAWEVIEQTDVIDEEAEPPEKVGAEAVRQDLDDILNDPLQLLSSLTISAPPTPAPLNRETSYLSSSNSYVNGPPSPSSALSDQSPGTASSSFTPPWKMATPNKKDLSRQRSVRTERRREKFAKVLKGKADSSGGVDAGELRRLAWSGIPDEVRPIVWQLLLNYLPLPSQPRLTTLSRKRKEYSQLVDQYFARGLGGLDQQIWHQIEIDVPRTRPGIPLWSCLTTQRSLERILYVWAIRHPASGYVQGINDLVCPFFQVFLSAYIASDPELFDTEFLPSQALSAIEADTFWCLSKLLDGIQDNYISQQPGIQRLVKRMGELVRRIDTPLSLHFEDQGVEFMQFAFRWMNCLLMREMSVKCTIRMWDTYLAEGTDAFSQFHLYVCSALLVKYSERLREMDFQEMIIFLQRLPTHSWTDHDVELLLSEAYVLKTVWQGAENHFTSPKETKSGSFGMLGR